MCRAAGRALPPGPRDLAVPARGPVPCPMRIVQCVYATAPGALPQKFVLDSAPFPSATLALYNEAGHRGPWTSECWVGVRPQ